TIEGNSLKLPPERLEPKFYAQVNKAIVAAGGKWKGGKAQAHIFDGNPLESIGLETGVVVDKKKLRQAFYTPSDIAEE
ncbi:hypothetical protein, partial [Streptococcus pneumoniae]|uniref:hypothetical protein n=1 Tax=Streptococcus pneumoniae TaxID=1313 RepID=UPI001E600EB1